MCITALIKSMGMCVEDLYKGFMGFRVHWVGLQENIGNSVLHLLSAKIFPTIASDLAAMIPGGKNRKLLVFMEWLGSVGNMMLKTGLQGTWMILKYFLISGYTLICIHKPKRKKLHYRQLLSDRPIPEVGHSKTSIPVSV